MTDKITFKCKYQNKLSPFNHRWPSFSSRHLILGCETVCRWTSRWVGAVNARFYETPEDSSLQSFLPPIPCSACTAPSLQTLKPIFCFLTCLRTYTNATITAHRSMQVLYGTSFKRSFTLCCQPSFSAAISESLSDASLLTVAFSSASWCCCNSALCLSASTLKHYRGMQCTVGHHIILLRAFTRNFFRTVQPASSESLLPHLTLKIVFLLTQNRHFNCTNLIFKRHKSILECQVCVKLHTKNSNAAERLNYQAWIVWLIAAKLPQTLFSYRGYLK